MFAGHSTTAVLQQAVNWVSLRSETSLSQAHKWLRGHTQPVLDPEGTAAQQDHERERGKKKKEEKNSIKIRKICDRKECLGNETPLLHTEGRCRAPSAP